MTRREYTQDVDKREVKKFDPDKIWGGTFFLDNLWWMTPVVALIVLLVIWSSI